MLGRTDDIVAAWAAALETVASEVLALPSYPLAHAQQQGEPATL